MAIQPLAFLIAEAFDNDPRPASDLVASRRRKKLWELPQHWLCSLLGTSLPVDEIRRLAQRAGIDESSMSDYVLHGQVVNACGHRSEIADLIQRRLEHRFANVVARFAKARGIDALLDLWQEALASGDVGGALWAASSHPDIDEEEGSVIYGDVHMLSHQISQPAKADPARLAALELANTKLRDKLAALRQKVDSAAQERAIADLNRRLAEAERRAATHLRQKQELADSNAALEQRVATLSLTIQELEVQSAASASESAAEMVQLRGELAATANALATTLALCDAPAQPNDAGRDESSGCAALAGRSVLCVGGRTGLIDQYRRVVESRGARFIHHDGGQEESMHRIDAILAGADIVLCQSSCVSHSAYWRLKDACKRRKLPCVFLKSTGITSFARSLESFAGEGGARQVN